MVQRVETFIFFSIRWRWFASRGALTYRFGWYRFLALWWPRTNGAAFRFPLIALHSGCGRRIQMFRFLTLTNRRQEKRSVAFSDRRNAKKHEAENGWNNTHCKEIKHPLGRGGTAGAGRGAGFDCSWKRNVCIVVYAHWQRSQWRWWFCNKEPFALEEIF